MPSEPQCTGIAATWCPLCGDCKGCDRESGEYSDECPLHGRDSEHAVDPLRCEHCHRDIGDDAARVPGDGRCYATRGFHDQRECYQLALARVEKEVS